MSIRPVPVLPHFPTVHQLAPTHVSRSLGNQSIPNNAATFISWDTEHSDGEGVYPSANWGAPFMFGDGQQGLWIVTANVTFLANAVGTRRLYFENAVGGEQDQQFRVATSPTGQTSLTLSILIALAGSGVGTLGLGVRVLQDSGAALDIQGAATLRARLLAYRLTLTG